MKKLAFLAIMSLIAGVVPQFAVTDDAAASSAQLSMGFSSQLTEAQKNLLDERWSSSDLNSKLICTGLFLDGAGFSERVLARKQAKAACTHISDNTALEFFYQGKPTTAESMVGFVFVRSIVQRDVTADQDEQSDAIESATTVSKTISLGSMDLSRSQTVSPELIRTADEKLRGIEKVDQVVCTAVIGDRWSANLVSIALAKARLLCETVSEQAEHGHRFQVKKSNSAWVGRLMVTVVTFPITNEKVNESVAGDLEPESTSPKVDAPVRPVPRPPQGRPSPTAPAEVGDTESDQGDSEQTPDPSSPIEQVPQVSLQIIGTVTAGERVTADFSNLPEGSTVICRWHDGVQGAGNRTLGTDCNILVPSDSGLFLSASVTSGGIEVFREEDRVVCSLCSAPEPEPRSLSLVGDKYVGQAIRVDVGALAEDESVTCSWESNGAYNNSIYSRSCTYTPNRTFSSGAISVRATVFKNGKSIWTSGFVSAGPIVYRPISPAPSLTISGDRFIGETLMARVGDLPEGASLTCTWDSQGSYNNTIFGRSCDFPLTRRFGDGGLWLSVRVTLANHATWSTGPVRVGAVDYRSFSPEPQVETSGVFRVGETVTAGVRNRPEGSTLSCNWYTPGYTTHIEHGTSCGITLTQTMANYANGANGLYVQISVGKTNFQTWSVRHKIPSVELLVFNPTLQILGERVVGGTLTASVTNIPEGTAVSCLWSRKNPSGANVSREEFSTDCSLQITSALKSSINRYSWGMDVTVRLNKSNYPQWSRVTSGIFIQ